ncbi:coiled-coil-helix-coiled-coil-helix domain-containing protein 10, mitochondrial-like [Glossina fuscipes]|nr:coiled-coil-helix-coiled-coil-helix domain-containing protein 10, mitochondrial-like [Glossina fuscipes]
MVRRGHPASPRPATRRTPSPSYTASAAPASPLATVKQPPSPATAALQQKPGTTTGILKQPSMFEQAAATAGGVAVGSAVGSVVGQGLTNMFSGSDDNKGIVAPLADATSPTPAPAPAEALSSAPAHQQYYANGSAKPYEPQGPCAWEIKQFLQCAEDQSDLTLCQGFNEALKQCKAQHYSQ